MIFYGFKAIFSCQIQIGRQFSPTLHVKLICLDVFYHFRFKNTFNLIPEYGLLHIQTCGRYMLFPSFDPMDRHFLDSKDGLLYVNDSQKPYDLDQYCIEFIKLGDSVQVKCLTLNNCKVFLFTLFLMFSDRQVHSYASNQNRNIFGTTVSEWPYHRFFWV